jgi:hypothetical protein
MQEGAPVSYTEQIQWRDAATGELLAASDYFQGLSTGAQVTPGYGGIIYDMIYGGYIMALQVLPASSPSPSPPSTSPASPSANNSRHQQQHHLEELTFS